MSKRFEDVMNEIHNFQSGVDKNSAFENQSDDEVSNHYYDFNASEHPHDQQDQRAISFSNNQPKGKNFSYVHEQGNILSDDEDNHKTQKLNAHKLKDQYSDIDRELENLNNSKRQLEKAFSSRMEDAEEEAIKEEYTDEDYNYNEDNYQQEYNEASHQGFNEHHQDHIEEDDDDYDDLSKKSEDEVYVRTIKTNLKKLFNFYSSFGNREGGNKMKCSQFLKLCSDSGIIDKTLDSKSVEIGYIYIMKSQTNLPYEYFVKLLHYLAQIKYALGDPNENFKQLLETNIIPLFEAVYQETDLGMEDKILKSKIGFATLMLVHLRKEIYFAIYAKYFKHEKEKTFAPNEKAITEKSRKSLIQFLRDFELLPNLLNISIVHNFFTEILSMELYDKGETNTIDLCKVIGKDTGLYFTFSKFVFILIKLSLYIFSDLNNIPKQFKDLKFTSDEKFYMMLERLELSQGFFDLVLHKKSRITLLGKEIADMHKETNAFPNFEDYIDETDNSAWMLVNFDFDIQRKRGKPLLYQRLKEPVKRVAKTPEKTASIQFDKSYIKAIDKYRNDLEKVFNQYSTIQDVSGIHQMNCFKFIKFLKDIKAVRAETAYHESYTEDTIGIKDADLIFTSATHSNRPQSRQFKIGKNIEPMEKVKTSKTIGFKRFLKALELVVIKIYGSQAPIEKAVENFYYIKIAKNLLASKPKNQTAESQPKAPIATEKLALCNKYLRVLNDVLKDEHLIEMLDTVHKCVYPLFSCYAVTDNQLDFDNFFSLFKDFGVFPDLITALKLEGIFDALSHVYKENPNNTKHKSAEKTFIDQHLFVESFILIANELKFNFDEDPTIYQKITFVLDIMNESDGFVKLRQRNPAMKKYNIVNRIRQRYPNYFLV